ncbi:MAG: hypothetical protein JSS09_00565, partial [Verrucomicrobia bacterium]|nr:hypothetical protein [Verrucomicrobiota bacterium]
MTSYFAKKISYTRAFSWIIGSSLMFSFLSHKVIGYTLMKNRKEKQTLSYIIQTGPQKEALLSDYLAELIGLSVDKPTFFSSFNVEEAKNRLLTSSIINEVQVKKIKPNMLYIDYTIRKPTILAIDFLNAALDREGVVIPMHPFFSPKKMPEIYFGEKGLQESGEMAFGIKVKGFYVDLAFAVLELLLEKGKDLFFIKRVDVSESCAPSLGKREVVVIIENELYQKSSDNPVISSHFLRLTPKHYSQEIA